MINFQVLDTVFPHLRDDRRSREGIFYGVSYKDSYLILGASFPSNNLQAKDALIYLPGGIKEIGQIVVSEDTPQFNDGYCLFMDSNTLKITLYCIKYGIEKLADFEIVTKSKLKDYYNVKIKGDIDVSMAFNINDINKSFEYLEDRLDECEYYVENSKKIVTDTFDQTLSEILSEHDSVVLVQNRSKDSPQSLSIEYFKEANEKILLNIYIETICTSHKDSYMFVKLFKESIHKYLRLYKKALMRNMCEKNKFNFINYTFSPDVLSHSIMDIYEEFEDENTLFDLRKNLHSLFNLPCDRSFFRKGNSVSSLISLEKQSPPFNEIIKYLKPSGIQGSLAFVQGGYSFYQNTDEDSCSFKCFQILFSWFAYHGYTDKSVPMIPDIKAFLNKYYYEPKTSITASELSLCMMKMLGVITDTINVSNEEEVKNLGGKLYKHFTNEGTPVVFSGNHNYVVVGVQFDNITEEIRFLVLDPHYTGNTDLKCIFGRGVSWQNTNFWNISYDHTVTICLPDKPETLF